MSIETLIVILMAILSCILVVCLVWVGLTTGWQTVVTVLLVGIPIAIANFILTVMMESLRARGMDGR